MDQDAKWKELFAERKKLDEEAWASKAPIVRFAGTFSFLSNFFLRQVTYEGVTWPTSEHAYQAYKTLNQEARIRILNTKTPGAVKKVGSDPTKTPLRPDWTTAKRLEVMESILRAKFQQNEDCRQWLLATGDRELIEGNTWGDKFWGQVDGQGDNHLGKILMKIRAELR